MIDIKNINKSIKNQNILKDVNCHISENSICGFVGNNGSGKTVLFKCILGFYYQDSGQIFINGKERTKKDGILTDAVALIEHPAFLKNYSGMQNLRYLYELNHKKDIGFLSQVMETVGLNPKEKKPVGKYSMGMQQRLAIAQVLMENKKIIILDEPMNGLDHSGVREIREIILQLKQQGTTILLASHNREDIDILCDDVYEMDAGEITKLCRKTNWKHHTNHSKIMK